MHVVVALRLCDHRKASQSSGSGSDIPIAGGEWTVSGHYSLSVIVVGPIVKTRPLKASLYDFHHSLFHSPVPRPFHSVLLYPGELSYKLFWT